MRSRSNSRVRYDGSYHALGCADVAARFLRRSGQQIELPSATSDGELGETDDWNDFLQSVENDLDVNDTRH